MDQSLDFSTEENSRILEQLKVHYRSILSLLGEDPDREGLQKTPERAAKAMMNLTRGYKQSPDELLSSAMFEYSGSQMIVVKDIEFYSFCEHHILPFFGKVHIGYIPSHGMIGLSKLARLVNLYAARLQVQERLTRQIVEALDRAVNHGESTAKGVIVMVEAQHLCMQMRGVEKQEAKTVTIDYSGDFADSKLRDEFLRMLGR